VLRFNSPLQNLSASPSLGSPPTNDDPAAGRYANRHIEHVVMRASIS
jgi:hypothetical protein